MDDPAVFYSRNFEPLLCEILFINKMRGAYV